MQSAGAERTAEVDSHGRGRGQGLRQCVFAQQTCKSCCSDARHLTLIRNVAHEIGRFSAGRIELVANAGKAILIAHRKREARAGASFERDNGLELNIRRSTPDSGDEIDGLEVRGPPEQLATP